MTAKYYVDSNGTYIGAFDGATAPAGAIEVPAPPSNAMQKWNGNSYDTIQSTQDDYKNAIQAMIDSAAQSRRYTDGNSLASYDNSTVPSWKTEAGAFIAWRDAVWIYAYAELAKVQAGEREQPTVAEFLMELPEIAWP